MVHLKLGLKAIPEHHIKKISHQLRKFSSQIAVVASDPKEAKPGTPFVTIAFEFDVASDEIYQAPEDQCCAWLDDPGSHVVTYTLCWCPPKETTPIDRKKTIPELWDDLIAVMGYQAGRSGSI